MLIHNLMHVQAVLRAEAIVVFLDESYRCASIMPIK
jgi:hypothetical protein